MAYQGSSTLLGWRLERPMAKWWASWFSMGRESLREDANLTWICVCAAMLVTGLGPQATLLLVPAVGVVLVRLRTRETSVLALLMSGAAAGTCIFWLFAWLLLGRLRHALHREAGRALVGEPLVVRQHGLDVLVPGDQVHLHAERVGEFAHALGLADLPKLRGGAERIAAHVQRRQLSCFGHD